MQIKRFDAQPTYAHCETCKVDYTSDHGCGVAVAPGSSLAEHSLNCKLYPDPIGGLFRPNDGTNYPPWEAPAGNCPWCWHRQNPDHKIEELSDLGLKAKIGMVRRGLL